MGALQSLRSISDRLTDTQSNVATGLRVAKSSDNAAYWSIATTMRSDRAATSAVSDALGLGQAKVDTAYTGINSVIDELDQFKAKLVTATEEGVDKSKVQTELDQLKQQILSTAKSSTFSGQNWLYTQQDNLLTDTQTSASVVSSYVRDAEGNVSVHSTDVPYAGISLFNTNGGGILQKEKDSDYGGLKITYPPSGRSWSYEDHEFTSAMALSGADEISFDLTLDADSTDGTTGSTYHVVINKSTVDSALGTSDGLISDAGDMGKVIEQALKDQNVPATGYGSYYNEPPYYYNYFGIESNDTVDSEHSGVKISGVTSTLAGSSAFGLENTAYGQESNDYAGSGFRFTSGFVLDDNHALDFNLQINTDPTQAITITKDDVDTALGITTGVIASASDYAQVLQYKLGSQGLDFSTTQYSDDEWYINIDINPAIHPEQGSNSHFTFSAVDGSQPTFDLMDVDITDPTISVASYLWGVDHMLTKATSAASTLGALSTRIDQQSDFASTMMDSMDSGIGRLVDADMEDESSRLSALQTQQQLAIQSLSIANSAPQGLLTLFQ